LGVGGGGAGSLPLSFLQAVKSIAVAVQAIKSPLIPQRGRIANNLMKFLMLMLFSWVKKNVVSYA
jgi:hypothetical protein